MKKRCEIEIGSVRKCQSSRTEEDGKIVVRPVRSVAGALKKYAAKGEGKNFKDIRESSWDEAMREKRLVR